jgi:hypothetical protein
MVEAFRTYSFLNEQDLNVSVIAIGGLIGNT